MTELGQIRMNLRVEAGGGTEKKKEEEETFPHVCPKEGYDEERKITSSRGILTSWTGAAGEMQVSDYSTGDKPIVESCVGD